MQILKVENLFSGYGPKNVLRNISFDLNAGESIAVIGANGSGKSTLLRALAGHIYSNNTVTIGGQVLEEIPRQELAKLIALHSQNHNNYFNYTVEESVTLGRYAHLRYNMFEPIKSEDYKMIARALAATDLTDLAQTRLSKLSGGQLQRVFLARTIAQDPKIILLDEPNNHLDIRHQLELMKYLQLWCSSENRSIITAHHDINFARQFADKLLVLKNGQKEFFGLSKEVSALQLHEAFSFDVASYMEKSFKYWQENTLHSEYSHKQSAY